LISTIEEVIDIALDKTKFENSIIAMLDSAIFLVNKSKANRSTVLKDKDEVFVLHALWGG
jgi:hypothetical protein